MRNKIEIGFAFLWITIFLLPHIGFCDTLRLKEIPEGKEGYEVEILEEKEDSFVIEIPKNEIKVIKRKQPTEVELWREKKVLWEDAGDYITIYLPKERIVLPEGYTGEEYDSSKVLEKTLEYVSEEGRPEGTVFGKGTGRIVGRVLKAGQPLKGAKVKIVNVSSPQDAFSRIFGPKESESPDIIFEATTDALGRYEFKNIPLGEYDVYWLHPDTQSWYRRLSEKPDIAVRPGETVEYEDIEIK